MLSLLKRGWSDDLAHVVNSARRELVITSPYMTHDGTNFILTRLHRDFRKSGQIEIVTNLTTLNMIQGSTEPQAVLNFIEQHSYVTIHHLPRLHAKVYVSDRREAIITSGNLTSGGLYQNIEYGVRFSDAATAAQIHDDILSYADLGATVDKYQLQAYCEAARNAKAAYQEQQVASTAAAKSKFNAALEVANDELIRLRLAGETTNAIFSKTILYLLRQYGDLSTQKLYELIQYLHPDLCDDTVDRVIDGKHYGKKWKHAVRSAQQTLKQQGRIVLDHQVWQILN